MSAKERPILMSGAMVRASLREVNPKTQTRRIAKDVKHPDLGNLYAPSVLAREPQHVIERACPYGQPGDRLWVREAWSADAFEVSYKERAGEWIKYFGPDHEHALDLQEMYDRQRGQWRPSIHMPRWACRLVLEIVSVRLERLQDISEADALAEGMTQETAEAVMSPEELAVFAASHILAPEVRARIIFETVWEKINGPDSWAQNPWVWVVEFKRVLPA